MSVVARARQVVILAGGLGTRMLPRTERIPKVLLDVAGRPFVDWLLERLAACGYDDIVFCIGHLGEQVREVVGDGGRFGVQARFVDEGKDLRGTGGALVLTREAGLLHDEFLVTYGDSYLPFDYAAPLDLLRAHDAWDAVMAVYENDKRWDASNVELTPDRGRVARYEKGSSDEALRFIDYGATALRLRALATHAPGARFGLDVVQHQLAEQGRMGACVARDRFYEIGSPQGHADLEARLREAPP